MNKEEFIEMRNKYSNDLECIKEEKINNHILYFGAKYKDAFTNIVKPFIHSDCLYKLH